jgi:hypothetical protein
LQGFSYKNYNQYTNTMKKYKVVLEIQVQEDTPLKASKKVQDWLQDPDTNWQYYVQEDENGSPIYSVDLDEADEDAVLISSLIILNIIIIFLNINTVTK